MSILFKAPLAFAMLLSMSFMGLAWAEDKDSKQTLSAKEQSMVAIAAFTANGDMKKLKTAFTEGLQAGLTVNEIKEILVQMYAYAGFPRSLNGLAAFMEILDERAKIGLCYTMLAVVFNNHFPGCTDVHPRTYYGPWCQNMTFEVSRKRCATIVNLVGRGC